MRPPAMREIPYCFGCWPGGPVTAPPCYKCGSEVDYFTSGLCARCHPHAPGQLSPAWKLPGPLAQRRVLIDSCPDCHAWGVTRTYGWMCVACRSFRETHRHVAACGTCGQHVALYDDGSCRLCHRQRSLVAHNTARRTGDVSLAEANRYGQQLFFAGMWHQPGTGKRPYQKKTTPADMRLLTPVTYRQLTLLEVPRDLSAGQRRGFPPPPHAGREAALMAFVADHAARHGWRPSKVERIRRAIRIMLGIQDTPGAPIRRSDVALLSRIKHSAAVVADVLDDAGLLDDDRQPAILAWFTISTAGLPALMRDELTEWLQVMRHGSTSPPRRKPRADSTISTHLRWALPTLQQWATTHDSLREIGIDDVTTALPADPLARYTTLQGLRSIFRILKARKLVFVNPTARVRAPQPTPPAPARVNLDALRADLNSEQPATAALAALLAFHAIRVAQLCHLQLTDLRDGHLHIDGQVIPLAAAVRQRLRAYLDHRQQAWPRSVNPHLFIHARSAITTRPVTSWWIRHQLGIAGQQIRLDRILDEAHATSGDIRQLMDLFGLSVHTAHRYAVTVNMMRHR
ncbi:MULTISPECIES: hypothetical protein [Micromonospora]|uniref:hypothetical protein n=1 Tax=Micromonospora TaxID=1873 RepID=UPI001FC9DDD8|nr:hypothetical protein [Micromonospora inaquosa]WSK49833.1 hypothetical protein OG423_05470 [Micromonospora zamorensis]